MHFGFEKFRDFSMRNEWHFITQPSKPIYTKKNHPVDFHASGLKKKKKLSNHRFEWAVEIKLIWYAVCLLHSPSAPFSLTEIMRFIICSAFDGTIDQTSTFGYIHLVKNTNEQKGILHTVFQYVIYAYFLVTLWLHILWSPLLWT